MAAIPWSVTVNDGANPLDGVSVWVTTDLLGTNVVANGYTNTIGVVSFTLDESTLYTWKQLSGYNATNPEAMVVASPGTGSTFSVSAVVAIPPVPATNSYGTPAGVSQLVPRYANGIGTFMSTDRPSLQGVVSLIDQVSGLLNSILSQNGFVIPVVQADVVLALTIFVQEEVASIVEGINGSGRFGPTTKSPNQSRFKIIMNDVQDFIIANADGFERLGATRTGSAVGAIGFRDTDQSGDTIVPMFEREAYGFAIQEWDS